MRANRAIRVSSTYFSTESGYDYVIIGGHRYSGSKGPHNVAMGQSEMMIWHSDEEVQEGGFVICGTESSPSLLLVSSDLSFTSTLWQDRLQETEVLVGLGVLTVVFTLLTFAPFICPRRYSLLLRWCIGARLHRRRVRLDPTRSVPGRSTAAIEFTSTRHFGDEAMEDHSQVFSVVTVPALAVDVATDSFDSSREIGSGAFGTVYRGRPLEKLDFTGQVAIKRLSANNPQGVSELWDEVQILLTCRHENLLPLLGYNWDQQPSLVFPLMEGGSLDDRLLLTPSALQRLASLGFEHEPPPLTWRERLRIVRDVTRALVYLHTPSGHKSVVLHRDVKPSNILLDKQLNAKLGDFGLARHAQELQQGRTHVTVASGGLGTPGEWPIRLAGEHSFGRVLLRAESRLPAPAPAPGERVANPFCWQDLSMTCTSTQAASTQPRTPLPWGSPC